MCRLATLFVVIGCFPNAVRAEPATLFVPGVKIGYTWDRGVTLGSEVSLFQTGKTDIGFGGAAGIDVTIGTGPILVRSYLHAEVPFLAMGGALLFDNGFRGSLEMLLWFPLPASDLCREPAYLAIPYYRFSLGFGADDLHEAGLFAKQLYGVDGKKSEFYVCD